MIMAEIWKDIAGYEGLYQVSNLGKVKSLFRRNGGTLIPIEHILADKIEKKTGYNRIHLSVSGTAKDFCVHRLVAQAFIDNPHQLEQVNHKDFNRANNCVENLEWMSVRENADYSWRAGRKARGERQGKAKLTSAQVLRMRLLKEITPSLTYAKLAKMFNVEAGHVSRIVNLKFWRHLPPYESIYAARIAGFNP